MSKGTQHALATLKRLNGSPNQLRVVLAKRALIAEMRKEGKTDGQIVEALQGVDHG